MEKVENLIKETLEEVLEKMGVEYEKVGVEKEDEAHYRVNVESDVDSALLIGWHGETMLALQFMLKILVWRKAEEVLPENFYLTLDIDGYRERQEENINSMVERKIEEVLESKRSAILPPMGAYFRRKVHMRVAEKESANLNTESVGEGEDRRVKIIYQD